MKPTVLLKKLHLMRSDKFTLKDKLLLAIISLGAVLLIIFIFYLICFSLSQKSVANFLPEKNTVAFIEFQDFTLPIKLENSESLNKKNLEVIFKQAFGIDFESAELDWDRNRFGIILIEKENSSNIPVLFMQANNRSKSLQFFKSLTLPEEELIKSGTTRLPIYSYPQSHSFNIGFVGPYAFVTNNIFALELIQKVYNGDLNAITNEKNYQKSISNLPKQDWVRSYLNFKLLNFADNIAVNNIIVPLKHIINHITLTIRKDVTGFHFNTFLNLTPDFLSLEENYKDKTKFAYKLTDYISSQDLGLYIGGANLSQEWQNTLSTISNLNPAYGIILESIIRAQVTKIFGAEVDLRNDFYPLFEGEYAFAVGKGENENIKISLILSHSDQDFVEKKLTKMMNGFKYLAAQFAPKLREVILPDGTISRELIADTSKLQETSETYKGYKVNCVEVINTSSGFCYTITDELMIITNNRSTATETIDLTILPKHVLSQHQPFRQTISNLSKVSDEITFIDIQKSLSVIANKQYGILIKPFLNELDAISWVKHYFDDGMSTEGYLLIK